MTYALGLALLAGALSTLSPCVLPLVPIVLGTARGRTPRGTVGARRGRRNLVCRNRIVRRGHRV